MVEDFETTPNSSQGDGELAQGDRMGWDDSYSQLEQPHQLCLHRLHAWRQWDDGSELLTVCREDDPQKPALWKPMGCRSGFQYMNTENVRMNPKNLHCVHIQWNFCFYSFSLVILKWMYWDWDWTLSKAHCQKHKTLCVLPQHQNLPNMDKFTSFIGYNLLDLLIADCGKLFFLF